MKTSITRFLLVWIFLSKGLVHAQSTEIRPGVILPQMTTAQRNALSATNGMLIFDTNTQSYWLRSNNTWTELPKTAATTSYWEQSGAGGNEIKNTNSGGFWSANPTIVGAINPNPPTAPVSGAGTRFMWIPSRSAFRVGTTDGTQWDAPNIGLFSTAIGASTTASGLFSTAMGAATIASGTGSTAMGASTTAREYATAMGESTIASGYASTAMGKGTTASGQASTALGSETTADGLIATATGASTRASGNFSTAMGISTQARGYNSTAIGYFTSASGEKSMAMGNGSIASGPTSTAMGSNTRASGDASTAMGAVTKASSNFSTAMGIGNVDDPSGLLMLGNGTANTPQTILVVRKDNSMGLGDFGASTATLATLHVNTSKNTTTGNATALYPTTATPSNFPAASAAMSIYASQGIFSGTYIGSAQNVVLSDARIKEIEGTSDNAQDLATLRRLRITDYHMKDHYVWGDRKFKKVIAQQVEEVYPQAVTSQKSFIPDIYQLASLENGFIKLPHHTLKKGERVKLIIDNREEITEVLATTLEGFKIADSTSQKNVFVYGREVSDFRSVDYEALSVLGISAIQQLAKENEALKSRMIRLETLVENLATAEATAKTGK